MSNVENIKKVLAFPLSLVKAIESAKVDGSINLADLPLFIDPVTKLPAAIEGAKLAKEEITNLDAAEKEALNQWVKDTFDLADDSLEAKIEKGLAVVFYLAELYSEFKK